MKIEENQLVSIEYQLFAKNSDGSLELMEETSADNPLVYIHGVGMMMPKFEEMVAGRHMGEAFEFEISAKDAYGERSDNNIVELPRDIFMQDGKWDEERFFRGAIVPLVDNTGQRINAEIVDINNKNVKVDLNHPLAGEDLHFKCKVLDVHTPTEAELAAMQSGGGCGCGCGCGSDNGGGCGDSCGCGGGCGC